MKSAKCMIRNNKRSRKTLQDIRGFIMYWVKSKISIENWLNSIPSLGVCWSNLFEFPNILKIKPRIKNFSLDDPNDLKLTQKKDIDKIDHTG